MNLNSIKTALTSKVGRQMLILQKHSPKLLFVAGVVGVGATVVLACRATLKVEPILDEHLGMAHNMKVTHENRPQVYTNSDYQKDLAVLHLKTFGQLAKMYGPSIVIGVSSIAALTGAHVILSKRNTAVMAAYATIQKGFDAYRQRVAAELGEEKEREFRLGLVDKEIVEETEEGPVVKTVKGADENSGGAYKFLFDEANSRSWERSPGYNQLFLSSQQNWANNRLQADGHLLLNDVLDMLGMKRTKAGCVVGWVKDTKVGDGFVDFGVFEGDRYRGMEFVKGDERSVWLDFNVDGVIYDLIEK